jgi:hypothetical protein
MLNYKEFYIWLEGYLAGRLESKIINIVPIVEKMGQVNEEIDFNTFEKTRRPSPFNPIIINKQDDDLGHPPKIVM